MISGLDAFLARRSSIERLAIIVALLAGVATSDYLTGPQISFSIFYLLPVAAASWYGPTRLMAPVCVASAACWFGVDLISIDYDNFVVPIWNAAVRLGFFAITAALLSKLRKVLKRQSMLADTDSLTGVMNRRGFERRCRFVFQISERHSRTVSIAYLDVDNFKEVNDKYGHRVGDEVLKKVASILLGRLRQSDLVARIGGDEFAILLPETGAEGAKTLIAGVQAELRNLADRREWPIGFSLGIVVFDAPFPPLLDALDSADRLMYSVKNRSAGGFAVEYYSHLVASKTDRKRYAADLPVRK
jgi:diguanylate cyclase (GGDEF)-like protein